MKAGTILFHGADLGLYGAPRFTLRKTPEPAAPAVATHRRVEISVSVELRAEMPATVWARARALHGLLTSTPEGLLEIRDENGTAVSWMATPGETTLPEVIERGAGRVEMSFSAREDLVESGGSIGIDTLDGMPPLMIARVNGWSENVSVTRPDGRSPVRSEVAAVISFTARTAYADPLAPAAVRAEALLAAAGRLNALSSKEIHLSYAGFSRVVQVESFRAQPSAGWEWLDVEAQARYVTLPGEEAEVSFTSEEAEDPATGEIRTVVAGSIKAPDKETAEAKLEAILMAWRTAARRVTRIRKQDSWLDGYDVASNLLEWTGLDFTLEFTESGEEPRYTLKIDTRDGDDGRKITYSGTAYAPTVTSLLAIIKQISGDKHPITLREESSIDMATDDEGLEKLVGGSFSHEYAAGTKVMMGSFTRTVSDSRMSDAQTSVSGSVSAKTLKEARDMARGMIAPGVILRTDDETEGVALYGAAQLLMTLAFSYAWGRPHISTVMEYEDASSPDYTRMILQREISGVCRAKTKALAVVAVKALVDGLVGDKTLPVKESVASAHERESSEAPGAEVDRWVALRFGFSYELPITGEVGHDIIEASFALQRIGMVNHEPMTEVPLMKPVSQTQMGWNIGRLVASGQVRARQQATARVWGQGKRVAASQVGNFRGSEDPPDERMGVAYVPFDGDAVTTYEFSFQYSFRYADGLDGLWSSDLTA